MESKKIIATTVSKYLNERKPNEKRFVIQKNKFKLFSNNILVAESGFDITKKDKWFNENYIIIYNLKVFKKFQDKGFAKYLLKEIFNYVKNELNFKIISLIVYKDNYKAVNLYFKVGFKIFMEYDDSYSLVKNLDFL
jgi:ribosomal protein S18 acetylase RimI-like enzyme